MCLSLSPVTPSTDRYCMRLVIPFHIHGILDLSVCLSLSHSLSLSHTHTLSLALFLSPGTPFRDTLARFAGASPGKLTSVCVFAFRDLCERSTLTGGTAKPTVKKVRTTSAFFQRVLALFYPLVVLCVSELVDSKLTRSCHMSSLPVLLVPCPPLDNAWC